MPKIINDIMVEVKEEDRKLIRSLGYEDAARVVGKTASYMRCLASVGPKPRMIRQSDLVLLQKFAGR